MLGVVPHLATYGKAMAGGLPLSMLAGDPELMSVVGDGTAMHGGTFNPNVVAIAAAYASLRHIKAAGLDFYTDLNQRGRDLMTRLRDAAAYEAWYGGAHDALDLYMLSGTVSTDFSAASSVIMLTMTLPLMCRK